MYLVEVVVAVGLSGIFVALITGMLSQNLALTTASQNQLIAGSAAELLIENAKITPYTVLSSFATNYPEPITLLVNLDQQGQPLPPVRQLPLQLDLTSTTSVYGTVNPFSGQSNPAAQWNQSTGNYFRGSATETFANAMSITGLASVLITVKVTYVDISSTSSKTTTRTAVVFANGATFQ
jgi:hypothetical protein